MVALRDLLPHAAINALFATLVIRVVEAVATTLGDEEGARRLLHLEPRSRPA